MIRHLAAWRQRADAAGTAPSISHNLFVLLGTHAGVRVFLQIRLHILNSLTLRSENLKKQYNRQNIRATRNKCVLTVQYKYTIRYTLRTSARLRDVATQLRAYQSMLYDSRWYNKVQQCVCIVAQPGSKSVSNRKCGTG